MQRNMRTYQKTTQDAHLHARMLCIGPNTELQGMEIPIQHSLQLRLQGQEKLLPARHKPSPELLQKACEAAPYSSCKDTTDMQVQSDDLNSSRAVCLCVCNMFSGEINRPASIGHALPPGQVWPQRGGQRFVAGEYIAHTHAH